MQNVSSISERTMLHIVYCSLVPVFQCLLVYFAVDLDHETACSMDSPTISHSRISKILTNLVSQGLLEQVDSKIACKYRISMSGKDFLREYRKFSEFTDSFGLTI